MQGYICGIADNSRINYCPHCGAELGVYAYYGDGSVVCDECDFHFAVIECEEEEQMGYLRKDMVIDTLKEDMEDTKKCYKYYQEKKLIEFCYNCMERAIDRLPQYYPENAVEESRWIPCSERLPENAMNVIAQFSSGTVTELRYAGNGIFEGIYDYSTKVIIAWMPLPEPYKE